MKSGPSEAYLSSRGLRFAEIEGADQESALYDEFQGGCMVSQFCRAKRLEEKGEEEEVGEEDDDVESRGWV